MYTARSDVCITRHIYIYIYIMCICVSICIHMCCVHDACIQFSSLLGCQADKSDWNPALETRHLSGVQGGFSNLCVKGGLVKGGLVKGGLVKGGFAIYVLLLYYC